MIKTTLISTAAAVLLAGSASAQQFVCAVGYANAVSAVGTGVAGNDEDADGGLSRGALVLAAEDDCLSKVFLSGNPSLLADGGTFTDNGRRPWDLTFKGASNGLSGALASFGYFGNGTGNEGRGPQAARMDPDGDAEDLGASGNGSAVPGTICEYFGGTTCDTGADGGFGSDGTPPGHDLADNHQEFVDAIHGANGPFGNGQPGNGGGDPTGGNGLPLVTVVDLIDEGSSSAELAPEPATMTLLASGLVGLAASARRRKKQP
jgi:hypothetical protein